MTGPGGAVPPSFSCLKLLLQVFFCAYVSFGKHASCVSPRPPPPPLRRGNWHHGSCLTTLAGACRFSFPLPPPLPDVFCLRAPRPSIVGASFPARERSRGAQGGGASGGGQGRERHGQAQGADPPLQGARSATEQGSRSVGRSNHVSSRGVTTGGETTTSTT